MWKLRIGALVTSGVITLGLSSTAWATSGGGKTITSSVSTPVVTTTSIGGVKTSIGAVETSRAKAHKRHRRVRHKPHHKLHRGHVKAVTVRVSTFT